MSLGWAWEKARAFILPALEPQDTEADLVADLESGHAQLWIDPAAALVTQIVTEPRSIHAWLGGGDIAGLLRLMPTVEDFGRAMGCGYASVEGRKGWARALKPYGYEPFNGELRKAL